MAKLFARCFAAVALAFVSIVAHAAIEVQNPWYTVLGSQYASAEPACSAYFAGTNQTGYTYIGAVYASGVAPFDTYNCRRQLTSNGTQNTAAVLTPACASGFTRNSSVTPNRCQRTVSACTPPQTPNPTTQICEDPPPCTANAPASGGYFDVGTNPGASPLLAACVNGCQASFDGISPAGSALVDGVKHYYASGTYYNTGSICTPTESNDPGTPEPTVPEDDCGPGQILGELNGRAMCADGGGDPTPESDPPETTETETTTTTAPDGTETTTTTTVTTRPDGSTQTTTTTTTTSPDGQEVTSTTETRDTPPIPGENTPEDPDDPDDPDADPCTVNPSAAGCGGAASPAGSSYVKKSKTFSDVLTGARNNLMASPLGTALGGFFTVTASASCPTWSANVGYLDVSIEFDQLCNSMALDAWAALGWCLVLVGAFFAFRVAIE